MLKGVTVLDATRLLPGAFCTLVLADLGADVIKIEEPGRGDYMRWLPPMAGKHSAGFNALNRNKRSITLNLKAAAGRDAFLTLAKTAQVVVEGNRPGVMDRLGIGWEVLHAANPKVVMCSITGYGQDGPLASAAGHDINYMAVAGALSMTGERGGAPLPLGLQIADVGGGAMGAAVAILAALLDVERGGDGRHLDVSMMEGALTWTAGAQASVAAGAPDPGRSNWLLTGAHPCYRVYPCADGYLSVGALEPKFWEALCEAVGRPDLAPFGLASAEDAETAIAEMEAVFARHTRAEWAERLRGLDVCVEPVLDVREVQDHPQVRARGLLLDTETGREIRPQVVTSPDWRRLPPPDLGEHTEEVLAAAGLDVARLRAEGAI